LQIKNRHRKFFSAFNICKIYMFLAFERRRASWFRSRS
jgi:hypothetical protein